MSIISDLASLCYYIMKTSHFLRFLVPNRLEVQPVPLKSPVEFETDNITNDLRPSKRSRIEQNGAAASPIDDLMSRVEELAGVFSATLDF